MLLANNPFCLVAVVLTSLAVMHRVYDRVGLGSFHLILPPALFRHKAAQPQFEETCPAFCWHGEVVLTQQ